MQDRAALWNAVEAAETRKNSQVAREIRVALPAELDHAQRVELVRAFCQREFVARGMVADIALHAPGREGDDRNHHAHILLTTREIGPEGFGAKNRDWNAVEMLEEWREAWARDSNRALERCGHDERIDHRTLEAQRIEASARATAAHDRGDEAEALRQTVRAVELDRDPLPQLSAGAWQMKERGIEVAAVRVWREVKAQAAEVARVAEVLAGQVRDWIGRAVDRLGPLTQEGAAQGLAYAGAADRDGREGRQDLAARLREAWEARQSRTASDTVAAPGQSPEPESARSLAERLRRQRRRSTGERWPKRQRGCRKAGGRGTPAGAGGRAPEGARAAAGTVAGAGSPRPRPGQRSYTLIGPAPASSPRYTSWIVCIYIFKSDHILIYNLT